MWVEWGEVGKGRRTGARRNWDWYVESFFSKNNKKKERVYISKLK